MKQFVLPLAWRPEERDDEFLLGPSNAAAVRVLEGWDEWPVRTGILAGPPRSGRSMLARLFAARTGGEVIDDADRVADEVLFHAWNQAQGTDRPLLLVARAAPPAWKVALPDLRSRLGASPVALIEAPDDALVRFLLERGFERLHVDARADLIAWLAARVERSHAAIEEAVALLARAALQEHRRLSIPLARATLAGDGTLTTRSDQE